MSGNGMAVGKRLGVQPVLARRVAAAGRNGKRLTTGEQKNVNELIGKQDRKIIGGTLGGLGGTVLGAGLKSPRGAGIGMGVGAGLGVLGGAIRKKPRAAATAAPAAVGKGAVADAVSRLARKPKALKPKKGFEHMYTKDLDPLRPANLSAPRLPSGKPIEMPSSQGVMIRRSRLQGYVDKAAAGTNGMGQLVPQFRGAALKSLTPQAPAFAPKQPKANSGLVATGAKPSAPSTAGLSGVGGTSSGGGAAAGGGSAGGVGKRSYDPEDERRHRQGALSATGVLGGSALAASGGKEIARDTRLQRGAPKVLHPGSPPQRGNGFWADMKTKRVRAIKPEELKGEEMAYAINRKLHNQKLEAYGRLAKPKGVQVTARSGGKVGGGLALLAGGTALYRRRNEPRYD